MRQAKLVQLPGPHAFLIGNPYQLVLEEMIVATNKSKRRHDPTRSTRVSILRRWAKTACANPELRIVEEEIESAIEYRNEALQTIRELGPPDLVHLIKQSKSGGKQSGLYHHVTGVDASSSASLAAYVNTLVYSPNDKTHKVVSGLYCCYNAFSHVDMRVDVKIPGGVESYCIDERGDKRVASEGLWLETFLCAVLRAYSYADDGSGDNIKKIVGVRRFDPITSTEIEHKFLDAAERLFFKGPQLGSDPDVQVPNLVSNHLTTGLLNYINTTGRYTSGINLFEKLRTREPEISSLLARVLLAADEEVQAVKLLHDTISELPMDYSLLDCQSTFCQGKGRLVWALECAKRSVTAAPAEFGTWAKLAEIYCALEQWDLALLTLNSCPMFTYQDKDAPRMPEPARILLPVMAESMLDEIDEPQQGYDSEMVHPSLRRLHAAAYKGTFLKAYSLLTEITAKIGWDQLLKIRSHVFVMEEEYRSEKQTGGPHAAPNPNSSTAALHSPSPKMNGETPESAQTNGNTTEDAADRETLASFATTAVGDESNGPPSSSLDAADQSLEKPNHTITSEEVKSGNDDNTTSSTTPNSFTQFRHKRLCERWLDNLFMVLYEDLRIYTIWRTDMSRAQKSTNNPNSSSTSPPTDASATDHAKSAEEWEILGDLSDRLQHPTSAIEAYQSCLRQRFSPKAMRRILKFHESAPPTPSRVQDMLQALIRLIAWQYRWYSEFSPELLRCVRGLIESEGAVKVRSIVQATSLPQSVLDLTHRYVERCVGFRSEGSDG
ncbi:MAG: bud site selection protein [Ramalina farinacea]|uniref:Bud site selection protein n=1 Tax=Ramalina farinacea TaxID=258253 RepID=A0AA43QXW5_9LECA|nr:bud site selection protein [Ramalina farinacea]